MSMTKILEKLPAVAIALLILFAILMIGQIFMYKSAEVTTDIITNTTHQDNVAATADSFNTTSTGVISVADVIVSLLIVFALLGLVLFLIRAFKNKKGNAGNDML